MDDLQNYQNLWFVIILVLFVGYSLLDGLDLGIGALLPFLAKNKEDKDRLIYSIAPVWDGNEVWLITGAGALFATFPQAYAAAFSGFYPAMMLILLALIGRAVSMEFRAYDEARSGLWEKTFVAGSALAAFLFGVALGNVVCGVPLNEQKEFIGNFFALLRPVPLWFGVTGFAAVLLQGAAYAVRKTEGALQERCFRAARALTLVNFATATVFFAIMALTFDDVATNWLFYVAVLCTMLWLGELWFSLHKKHEFAPLWEASFAFIGLWLAVGAIHFPHLIKASNDPMLSLTIYNSSTGLNALKIMTVIALVGMPVVVGYTIFVYRIFKGKTASSSYH
jgi:cytochrome d ubiquinol oxidase subunit II